MYFMLFKQIEYVCAHRQARNSNNVILRTSFAVWHTAWVLNRCDTPQAFCLIIFLHLKWSLTVDKIVHLSLSVEEPY